MDQPLATGRSAIIYPWPEDRVLKLFAADTPAAQIEAELAASREAQRLLDDVPACHGMVEVDGRQGLVFDRIHGESLTAQAERNPLRVRAGARVLAREHALVHAVATEAFPEVRAFAQHALTSPVLAFLTEAQRGRAAALIDALPEGDRLLHMDFHTENVFAHEAGHVVIDWPTALRGCPAADVAMTVLLIRDAELWPGTPAWKQVAIGLVRRVVLSTYLAEYARLTRITPAEIEAWRPVALVVRMTTLDIASERARFRSELIALLDQR